MNTDGSNACKVTTGQGEKTDASFSPDGKYIVYSSDEGEETHSSIYVIPTAGGRSVKVTDTDAYDGAPSWSPDGKHIAFESTFGVSGSENTRIWIIASPYSFNTQKQ
jgi:TolB protein